MCEMFETRLVDIRHYKPAARPSPSPRLLTNRGGQGAPGEDSGTHTVEHARPSGSGPARPCPICVRPALRASALSSWRGLPRSARARRHDLNHASGADLLCKVVAVLRAMRFRGCSEDSPAMQKGLGGTKCGLALPPGRFP